MANPFAQLKQIAQILDLISDLQKMDADKDGKTDVQEILVIGSRMMTNYLALQADFTELAALVGEDVEEIKKKFGIEDTAK